MESIRPAPTFCCGQTVRPAEAEKEHRTESPGPGPRRASLIVQAWVWRLSQQENPLGPQEIQSSGRPSTCWELVLKALGQTPGRAHRIQSSVPPQA